MQADRSCCLSTSVSEAIAAETADCEIAAGAGEARGAGAGEIVGAGARETLGAGAAEAFGGGLRETPGAGSLVDPLAGLTPGSAVAPARSATRVTGIPVPLAKGARLESAEGLIQKLFSLATEAPASRSAVSVSALVSSTAAAETAASTADRNVARRTRSAARRFNGEWTMIDAPFVTARRRPG